ncbi:methyltransferase type 12 [Nocardioides szechwanensis]|uniref:Methyltransferase domain-containing protein n=1 Tax=Nocardioides szechwanensis TaxID=1005944 RepID=A0A1H0JV14_9ACTN|nr:class I SAM-dependent methyltransferase [Nocardioides szechwanensis]GEP35322.1 methyltransferase type 12 [Nocardioides szechwanensis]SDO47464.1 Methyltransferase domain-containing protein [Nocardioides szechwanensis]
MLQSTEAFDAAFSGQSCEVVRANGSTHALATHLWSGDTTATDVSLFVDPCHGPTLDVGCGPGRLAGALASRGLEVLGIDTSPEAVRLTLARGAMALRRDIFDELPIGSQWSHVLLADGNIGLGGDPVVLLRRILELLDENGTVLVELAGPGVPSGPEQLRLKVGDTISTSFAWCVLGVDDIERVAADAGLIVMGVRNQGGRVVATLRPRGV